MKRLKFSLIKRRVNLTQYNDFEKEIHIRKYLSRQDDIIELLRLIVQRNFCEMPELDGLYIGKNTKREVKDYAVLLFYNGFDYIETTQATKDFFENNKEHEAYKNTFYPL